jgi:hypothetical protein
VKGRFGNDDHRIANLWLVEDSTPFNLHQGVWLIATIISIPTTLVLHKSAHHVGLVIHSTPMC